MTARTIKPEDIEGYIGSEHYFNAAGAAVHGRAVYPDGSWEVPKTIEALNLLTFCVIVLKNGFTLTGMSACADPAKYNKEIGETVARADALNKAWPLMGYVLRSQVAGMSGLLELPENWKERAEVELRDLKVKIEKLRAYLKKEFLTADREELENQLDAMINYAYHLRKRIEKE